MATLDIRTTIESASLLVSGARGLLNNLTAQPTAAIETDGVSDSDLSAVAGSLDKLTTEIGQLLAACERLRAWLEEPGLVSGPKLRIERRRTAW
jgi:hypothetical protein